MADYELDTRGLNCPVPIMRTKKAIEKLPSGQTLRVVATDPGAVQDFKAYAKQTGNTLVESRKGPDGDFIFVLMKA